MMLTVMISAIFSMENVNSSCKLLVSETQHPICAASYLSVHSHEQKVGGDKNKTEDDDPNSVTDGQFPEFDEHDSSHKFGGN